MSPKADRTTTLRAHIASEAARLMVESGIDNYHVAKRKAAERLRLNERHVMPGNDEVEAAVGEYQRLFRGNNQSRELERLRRGALQAMRFLERFSPRLVGSVLSGTADVYSEVCLHLFSEPTEAVGVFLMDRCIPFELAERRLRVAADEQRVFPAYRFVAGEVPIELVVFDRDTQRHPPLSPVDGKPMRRANVATVTALVEEALGSDVR